MEGIVVILNLFLIVVCILSFKWKKDAQKQNWKIQAGCEQVRREQLQQQKQEAARNPYGRD